MKNLFRVRYLYLALLALMVLIIDASLALMHPVFAGDVALERGVQGINWGFMTSLFYALDWFEGIKQVAAAIVGVVIVLILARKGFFLMIWGALSGAGYTGIEMLVARSRPDEHLVHVIRHTSGHSFPSGHMVFFTWFLVYMLIILGRKHIPPSLYRASWGMVGGILLLVAIGRVYMGEHWPSDVVGGLLLGVVWVGIGLSIRPLSDGILEEK